MAIYFLDTEINRFGGALISLALACEMLRVQAYPTRLEGAVEHNAWWDAMALRHLSSA